MAAAPAHPNGSQLSSVEVERGLVLTVRDGVFTQMMVTLTGGVFLIDFALGLGASNLAVGVIAAIPALANLLQLPAVALVESIRRRRAIVVILSVPARALFFLIALLPFLPASMSGLGVSLLIAALALLYGVASISHCAWNSWMRDLVPTDRLGGLFARRMMLAAAISAVLAPIAGGYVEWFRAAWPAAAAYTYVPLFIAGGLAGLIGVWILAITPEPPMAVADDEATSTGFIARTMAPLRDANFRRVTLFLLAWNGAANLAAPFFAVYMLRRIGLEVGLVTLLTATFQLANLAAFGPWGRIADRHASRSVLDVAVPGFICAIPGFILASMFETPAACFAVLLVLHVALGLAHAGVALTGTTLVLKLAPPGQATAYVAVVSLIANLAGGLAPIAGGWLADRLAAVAVPLGDMPGKDGTYALGGWDILFLTAFALGLLAIVAERGIREAGAIGGGQSAVAFIRELAADAGRGLARLFGRHERQEKPG